MNANTILILYLIFFFTQFGWESILQLINMSHVRRQRGSVPEFFKETFTFETYDKAVNYTLVRGKFSMLTHILSAAFTLCFILSGWLGGLDSLIDSLKLPSYLGGLLYIGLIFLCFQLIYLPFSLYRQFVIEEKFGFNKMTPKLYFTDLLKNWILGAILGIPLLSLLFLFMDKSGGLWWIWGFCLFMAFQFLLLLIYPNWIAPIFNKFHPLEEGSLRDRIFALAEKLDFKTKGIFVMDGSRRTLHSNAYFTGLGKNKRIVLFDTLIKNFGEEEIVAILAHEIGHQKKKHLQKVMFISAVEVLIIMYVLSLLLKSPEFFAAFQYNAPGYHSLIVLLLFCAGPFTFFLSPLMSLFSRKHEYEADAYAVKVTGTPDWLKNALLSLGKDNLSNLTPHPLYSFFYYSHPTLSERITALGKVNHHQHSR